MLQTRQCLQLFLLISTIVGSGIVKGLDKKEKTYDDEYYYTDEYYSQYQDYEPPEYEFSDLVKEWKIYMRNKTRINNINLYSNVKPAYECSPKQESYWTADEKQCDKYTECNIKGELKEILCPDGLVFEQRSEKCDYPSKVNCTGRPVLQKAQPSKNCPRANGFYAWPPEESCQKFWDCRNGQSYLQTCPEGVIFDPTVDACVTPDQAGIKAECTAKFFLGFTCPEYTEESVLRFGNHDRLRNPDNCQEFYSCLITGEPRLGRCPKKTVFNVKTGNCAEPEDVPGCEDFWKKNETEEYTYDYYA